MGKNIIILISLLLTAVSCIKKIDLSQDKEKEGVISNEPIYLYPFGQEAKNCTAEIIIKTNASIAQATFTTEIPKLKYNKSWLFMLTQDDCKQAAYSCTWAAINGKPLSNKYFYDAGHLREGDLPPDIYYLGKTLGSTDGAGNENRFAFTTTLAPDVDWMNAQTSIALGYTGDYYRFSMKSGLIWNNVRQMLNYGCGIAFHNVKVTNEKDESLILKQLPIVQDSILKHLDGRGCKFLAEPDGNKAYVNAAASYAPIQTMTAQAGATKLYPFAVEDDLRHTLVERWFNDVPNSFKSTIEKELAKPKEERMAICIGVHGTDKQWVQFLQWINDTYGKDGDDSVWAPSQEEYYEYNYYRIHGSTQQIERVDDHTLKLTVELRPGECFYYPAVTVNVKGLTLENVTSVTSNDAVAGLSYTNYDEGLMLNIDCRRFLAEHATHFVEQYEKDKTNASNKADARYFVSKLKASDKKTQLLNRVK